MSDKREYDLVVFGASGFTGRYVVKEVARTVTKEKLNWAVAGRSMNKLQESVDDAARSTGENLEELVILIADVTSKESIAEMCRQTRLVLNCVGPYRFYGSVVVEACIENGTHHVDISGETEWLERTFLECNKGAQESGVYVLQACGFDSIPCEMGNIFTKEKFQGQLDFIESYVQFKSGPSGLVVNDGTWRSLVHSLATKGSLREVRSKIYPQTLPSPNKRAPKRAPLFFSDVTNTYCIPFLGSDKSIVQRTNYTNFVTKAATPVPYHPYLAVDSYLQLARLMFIGIILFIFTKFSLGVKALEAFPNLMSLGMFSSEGPSKKQVDESTLEMTFVGEGSSSSSSSNDNKIVTKIIAPEAGYITTPVCMVQSAYIILNEAASLPVAGVLTPGRAFEGSRMLQRLESRKVSFKLVDV